jgi:3-(3-hydroxy-phenyl)propionate hydroxylase
VNDVPWLKHYAVSRWDAPRDSTIRDRSLLDSGNRIARRYGGPPDTMVLVRPDDHIAAITPMGRGAAQVAYRAALELAQREAVRA